MPIDYNKYPKNWKSEIRPAILERDGNKCKWCGVPNYSVIIRAKDGSWEILEPSTSLEALELDGVRLTKIILTVAHVDHNRYNNDFNNLAALCQRCHLNHDKGQHRMTRERKKSIMIDFNNPKK